MTTFTAYRKKFFLILATVGTLCTLPSQLYSQGRWEFGVGTGPANYLGEIGGEYEPRGFIADMQVQMTRPGFTVFSRYHFTHNLSINMGLSHGWIQGADSLSQQDTRFSRNLSFRNQIFELHAYGEYEFIDYDIIKRGGRFRLNIAPYIFAGAAVFFHNPKTFYNGEWVELQPLRTEGIQYEKMQFSLPMGGGINFTIGKHHRIGWQVGWRKTFTDYLDDVSSNYKAPSDFSNSTARTLADRSSEVNPEDPRFIGTDYFAAGTEANPGNPAVRGNPDTKDSYMMSYFTYSYIISSGRSGFSHSRYNFSSHRKRNFKGSYNKSRRGGWLKRLFKKKRHLHPHF